MKIEVLIADDHAIIRDGLKKIIDDTDDLLVAGEAANGNQVLEQVRSKAWGILVLDLSMPGRSGIELIKLVKADCPKLPILIFSMHPEEQYAVRAIRAGASGYLSKESDSDLLLPAIRRVASGAMFISPKVAELLAADVSPDSKTLHLHNKLSNREFEIFSKIVQGQTMTEIAEEFSLSIKTVSTHKTHILEKLGLSNQVDLVRYAIEHKLLDLAKD
jgi:two-component system, NarL family, invasion response regulator UvrY